jgi:sigma-B regulation protein RsbU (phosphoserine phosphatase)
MPAALLMSNLQAVLRATARAQQDPAELVRQVNEHICSTTTPERFATLFVGLLDPENCRIEYVNAGHNPPFLVSPEGEIQELPATGMPIGFLSEAPYESRNIELVQGTRLVVFSDGITEAFSRQEEMFGESRLAGLVKERTRATSQELMEAVFEAVRSWCQGSDAYQDDCTLLILNCVGM